jgi:hypothetical protein
VTEVEFNNQTQKATKRSRSKGEQYYTGDVKKKIK